MLVDTGFLGEGVEAGIGIAYLVRKFEENAGVVSGVASLRKPCDGVVGEWNEDVLAGFLHLGVQAHRPVRPYGEFAPGEFVDVGVPEAGEAGEHECGLDVILGPVFGFRYFLNFIECEECAGLLLGPGLEACVNGFAWILENDSFALGFVEGDHHAGEKGFFVHTAQFPWLVGPVFLRLEVNVQEFVFPDSIYVDVQIYGLVPVFEFLEANLYRLLYLGFILVLHDNQSFISENKYKKYSGLLQ